MIPQLIWNFPKHNERQIGIIIKNCQPSNIANLNQKVIKFSRNEVIMKGNHDYYMQTSLKHQRNPSKTLIHQRTQSCIPMNKNIITSFDISKTLQNQINDKERRASIQKRRMDYMNKIEMKHKIKQLSYFLKRQLSKNTYCYLFSCFRRWSLKIQNYKRITTRLYLVTNTNIKQSLFVYFIRKIKQICLKTPLTLIDLFGGKTNNPKLFVGIQTFPRPRATKVKQIQYNIKVNINMKIDNEMQIHFEGKKKEKNASLNISCFFTKVIPFKVQHCSWVMFNKVIHNSNKINHITPLKNEKVYKRYRMTKDMNSKHNSNEKLDKSFPIISFFQHQNQSLKQEMLSLYLYNHIKHQIWKYVFNKVRSFSFS